MKASFALAVAFVTLGGTASGAGFSVMDLALAGTYPAGAAGPPTGQIIVFPGNIFSVTAPGGSGARIFYHLHIDPGGSQDSPVFLDNGHGEVERVATVARNMGVAWSQDGRRVFLQDNWGSNVADCYAITLTTKGVRGFSLSKLIRRTPGRPKSSEGPSMAHYYVHCDGWSRPDQIVGAVSGHTDTNPSHDFDHPFVYDVRTNKITWRR